MANEFLDGTEFLLYINETTPLTTDIADVLIPGDFELVACLTSNGFDGTTATIDTSSKCSGNFTTALPGDKSWTVAGEGNAIPTEALDARINHNKLFELWKNGTTVWIALFDTALFTVRYGQGFITSFSDAGPRAAAQTFSVTFQGVGEPSGEVSTT